MTLKDKILFIRQKIGLTQSEFAKEIGRSQTDISRYESGLIVPRMDTINKIVSLAHRRKIKISLNDLEI